MVSLSVIVASGGRPSLSRTLESIVPQLSVYDQLVCLVDQRSPFGHSSRNVLARSATGDYLVFCDDDDWWVDDAVEVIRAQAEARRGSALLFGGLTLAVPNIAGLPAWDGESGDLERYVSRLRCPVVRLPAAVVGS